MEGVFGIKGFQKPSCVFESVFAGFSIKVLFTYHRFPLHLILSSYDDYSIPPSLESYREEKENIPVVQNDILTAFLYHLGEFNANLKLKNIVATEEQQHNRKFLPPNGYEDVFLIFLLSIRKENADLILSNEENVLSVLKTCQICMSKLRTLFESSPSFFTKRYESSASSFLFKVVYFQNFICLFFLL